MMAGFTANGNGVSRDIRRILSGFGFSIEDVTCKSDLESLFECEPQLKDRLSKYLLNEEKR